MVKVNQNSLLIFYLFFDIKAILHSYHVRKKEILVSVWPGEPTKKEKNNPSSLRLFCLYLDPFLTSDEIKPDQQKFVTP